MTVLTKEGLEYLLNTLKQVKSWCKTGSNYICDPPVEDTDIDYVVLSDFSFGTVLDVNGWTHQGNLYSMDGKVFDSFRKYNFNIIVVYEKIEFRKWFVATREAKKQNILDKGERISFFEKVFNNLDEYDLPKPIQWI